MTFNQVVGGSNPPCLIQVPILLMESRELYFAGGYGGIGRRAGFRFQWATVQVQVLLPAPRQKNSAPFRFRGLRKRRENCTSAESFFLSETELSRGSSVSAYIAPCFHWSLDWDSKGAGVNDVPGARQSRAPARPQAGSPVRVTKKERIRSGFSLFW